MDIGVYLFMTDDEFLSFVEFARSKGADLIFAEEWKQWQRVESTLPLPVGFRVLLRRSSKGSHLIYLCVGDTSGERDPDNVSPPKLVCAYFGGRDGDILYETSFTMRSDNPETIEFVKLARKWLQRISRTGIDVFSLPEGAGRRRDRGLRYTEGAREAVEAGAKLRQGGVKLVGYAIGSHAE
jgi:hypothetical protein